MAFLVPTDIDTITGAVLHISQSEFRTNLPTVYAQEPEILVLSRVSTRFEAIRKGGLGMDWLYPDLGEGAVYGSGVAQVSGWGGFETDIRLNGRFLQELKSHFGEPIVLGGRITSLDASPGNGEALFDSEQAAFGFASLELERDCGGVPAVRRQLLVFNDSKQDRDILRVEACGGGELIYHWFHDGVPLGLQGYEWSVPRTPGSEGSYRVGVSNALGQASTDVTVIPKIGLNWSQQPRDLALPEGNNASLIAVASLRGSCDAGGCSRVIVSQWFKDGQLVQNSVLTSIVDSLTLQLPLEGSGSQAAGGYRVILTSADFGSITSVVARVSSVRAPPFIAPILNTSIVVPYQQALLLDPDVQVGGPPASFTWLFNDAPIQSSLPSALLSIPSVDASNVGRYQLIASNVVGSVTSEVVHVNLGPSTFRFSYVPSPMTVIQRNPTSFWARIEGNATWTPKLKCYRGAFFGAAAAGPPPTYQWYFNASPISGEVRGSLVLLGVTPASAGSYYLVADNPLGSVTSRIARLTVVTQTPQFTRQPIDATVDAGRIVSFLSPGEFRRFRRLQGFCQQRCGHIHEFGLEAHGHDESSRIHFHYWPESSSDTEADVTALASGNRLTVVVTKKGQVRWTADGLSWTVSNALTNHALNSISFQNGIFVAVGADQTVHVSSDLTSWKSSELAVPINPSGESESNPEPVSFNDVAVGLGRFVVVGGYFRSAEAIILTSTDAQHWSPHLPLSGKRLRAVHFAAGMFVAVGNEGEVVTSEDGEIWTRRMSGVRVEGYNFRDIAYGSGRWAAVGTRGILCTSRDGRIWTVHHLEYLDTLQAAAGVGDRLLVAGERGVLLFSSPAASRLNWTTPAPLLTVTAGWLSSTQLERSTDLRTWEPFREVTGDQETVRIEIVPLSRGNEFFRALDAE